MSARMIEKNDEEIAFNESNNEEVSNKAIRRRSKRIREIIEASE